jgi:hypothetical protein
MTAVRSLGNRPPSKASVRNCRPSQDPEGELWHRHLQKGLVMPLIVVAVSETFVGTFIWAQRSKRQTPFFYELAQPHHHHDQRQHAHG